VAVALAALSASCGGSKKQSPGDGGTSSACRNSLDCPASKVCDPSIAMCVECITAADCPVMNDCTARTCVPYVTCTNSLDCPSTEVCDAASGRCVACLTNADCADATKICVANACQTMCTSDRTCTPLGLLCDPTTSSCVRCLKSADCPTGQYCQGGACLTSICTPGQRVCMLNSIAVCNSVGDGYDGEAAVPCAPNPCVVTASGPACATADAGMGASGGGAGGAGGTIVTGAGGAGGAGVGGASGGAGGAKDCGLIIDNMEADTGLICRGNGRIGHWYTYNDQGTSTVQTPAQGTFPVLPAQISPSRGTSNFAMHTTGTFASLMGIGCSLNGAESVPEVVMTYDVSKFTGISFYAKGSPATPQLQAIVQTTDTETPANGGTCAAGTSCTANRVYITLDPTNWTLYQLPFTMFINGTANFVAAHAMTVEFLIYNNTGLSSLSADFWIDDLSFY
jgi:hypothetical protein